MVKSYSGRMPLMDTLVLSDALEEYWNTDQCVEICMYHEDGLWAVAEPYIDRGRIDPVVHLDNSIQNYRMAASRKDKYGMLLYYVQVQILSDLTGIEPPAGLF